MEEPKNGDCCGGNDCGCGSESSGNSAIKTIAFFGVILLAGAITVYSLFFKSAGAGKAGCVPGETAQPLGELSTIQALNEKLGDLDFAFVVLADAQSSDNVQALVDSALSEIGGEKAGIVVIEPENELFDEISEEYIITGFPAVLAVGRYGHRLLIGSGITRETLMMSHKLNASAPVPCC